MPTRVLTLAIEISNPSAAEGALDSARPGVAIGEGDTPASATVLGVEPLAKGRDHDNDLLPAIDRLTRRLAFKPRDLTRVAVSAGPGGFTSLRLAVAAAKMICEVTGAHPRAVPTANVAARAFVNPASPFAVALASKHDSVYITVFDRDATPAGNGRIITASEIPTLGVTVLLADSYLPQEIRDACAKHAVTIAPLNLDAASCFFASLVQPDIDPLALAPIYPREPEAVTKWRALHPERYPTT